MDTAPENEPASPRVAAAEPVPAFPVPTFGLPPTLQAPAAGPLVPPARPRTGWFWIPLSFIFLLLGVVMGFQIALTYRNQQPRSTAADPYALELTVVQFGENLHLKWNTEAAAFSTARSALDGLPS